MYQHIIPDLLCSCGCTSRLSGWIVNLLFKFPELLQNQSQWTRNAANVLSAKALNLWQCGAEAEHCRCLCKRVFVWEKNSREKLQQICPLSREDVLTFSDISQQPSDQEPQDHRQPAGGRSAPPSLQPTSCAGGCGRSAWLPTQALSQPSLIPLHRRRREIRLTHRAAPERSSARDPARRSSTKSSLSASLQSAAPL